MILTELLVCFKCGGNAYIKWFGADECLEYCDDCGVIEQ